MSDKEPGDLPEDLEELARRYVDLWQDQMTALAADPAFAESLQKIMASMGAAAGGLPAMWSAWPAAMTSLMAAAQPHGNIEGRSSDGAPQGELTAESGDPATPRTAAAAASSHGGGGDLDVLARRLAALEQRVLALEGGTGRARRGAKKKTGRS